MHTICKIVACEKEKSDKKKIGFHEYTSAKKKKKKENTTKVSAARQIMCKIFKDYKERLRETIHK